MEFSQKQLHCRNTLLLAYPCSRPFKTLHMSISVSALQCIHVCKSTSLPSCTPPKQDCVQWLYMYYLCLLQLCLYFLLLYHIWHAHFLNSSLYFDVFSFNFSLRVLPSFVFSLCFSCSVGWFIKLLHHNTWKWCIITSVALHAYNLSWYPIAYAYNLSWYLIAYVKYDELLSIVQ